MEIFENLIFVGSLCLIGFLFHCITKAHREKLKIEIEDALKIIPSKNYYRPPVKIVPSVGSPNWQHNRISQYFDSQSFGE